MSEILAFVDVETTGLDSLSDRIIEVAVIIVKMGEEEHEGICTLVNPGVALTSFIIEYTGITEEMLTDAPGPDILHKVFDIIGQHKVVAYNASFDAGFLAAEARRLGRTFENDRECLLELTRELHPNLRNHKLDYVCQAFDIQIDKPAHRALGDVERAIHLWLALKKEQQPNPDFVRFVDLAQDYSVVAYYQMDGTPILVRKSHADEIDLVPENPAFQYHIRKNLNGEYHNKILGKNLNRDAAESLMNEFMRQHPLTLLNTPHFYRPMLHENLNKHHDAKRKLWEHMDLGRAREKTDPESALVAYEVSVASSDVCARIKIAEGLFGDIIREIDAQHFARYALMAIDRISLILCRLGRPIEAQTRAKAFFETHPGTADMEKGLAVQRRISKAIARVSSTA